jgi:hypothetical protein
MKSAFQGFSQSSDRSESKHYRESQFGDVEVQTTQPRTNIGSDVIDFNDTKTNIGQVNDLQMMRKDSMTRTERESYLKSIHQQICELKKWISKIDRETFCLGKWTALNEESPHPEHKSIHCFLMSRSWPRTGMINYLTKGCGGNVHDRGTVTVTGNSPQYSNRLRQVVELEGDYYYLTEDKSDQWICHDFHDMRVTPRGYSIRTNGDGNNGTHLRSWVIEGTTDSAVTGWTEIDRRENNSDLNGVTFHPCFPIIESSDESYRYIRLRMTGPTHANNHHLYILGFELFGELYTP